MNAMISCIECFIHNDEGATAIEYGLIAALIAVVIVAAVTAVGTNLGKIYCLVATSLVVSGVTGPVNCSL